MSLSFPQINDECMGGIESDHFLTVFHHHDFLSPQVAVLILTYAHIVRDKQGDLSFLAFHC